MAILTGLFTLGRDAELRTTQSGDTTATLALAYNYGRKGEDGKTPSQWVRATLWGKRAESLAHHLTKGKQISAILDGLHVQTFQKNDGTTGTSLEARVVDLEFTRGQAQSAAPAPAPTPAPRPAPRPAPVPAAQGSGFDDMDSDIPF